MDCIVEFGPHTDHDECQMILDGMTWGLSNDEPYYLSGTGELSNDESYVQYLNNY